MTINTKVAAEIQGLSPDAVIELFDLDMTSIGGPLVHFHAGTNSLYQPIVWQGVTYTPYPIIASGFEFNGRGQLPRPKITVSNIVSGISALVLLYGDLIGCKVTRRRTFQKFLDAVNFAGGVNATADSTAEFPQDIFYIEQRVSESRDAVEFQLSASFDFQGLQLPRRPIVQNVCTWRYRVYSLTSGFDYSQATCPYTGTAMFDANDIPVASGSQDVCGKRLSSCKARFGVGQPLPYGSFPACGIATS
jgi:lambda family phage minor tail protein L